MRQRLVTTHICIFYLLLEEFALQQYLLALPKTNRPLLPLLYLLGQDEFQ